MTTLSTPTTRAYAAYLKAGARHELAARSSVIARGMFVAAILLVFSQVWGAVLEHGGLPGRSRAELIWYIVITELVVVSFPYLHLEVEADLRSGDLVARLPQPVSYASARVCEAVGRTAVRMGLLLPVAFACAALFGRGVPSEPAGVAMAVLLLAPAALFAVLCSAAIGVTAIWLHDASPVFWLWQKLAFALGGLLLPLEVYPRWLADIARWTPFAAMLNGPARMVFGFNPRDAAEVAAQLIAWNIAALLLLTWLWSRALRRIDASGG